MKTSFKVILDRKKIHHLAVGVSRLLNTVLVCDPEHMVSSTAAAMKSKWRRIPWKYPIHKLIWNITPDRCHTNMIKEKETQFLPTNSKITNLWNG